MTGFDAEKSRAGRDITRAWRWSAWSSTRLVGGPAASRQWGLPGVSGPTSRFLPVAVAVRARRVPFPRGGDDGIDIGELHFPAELALGFARVGVERRRIAGAARALDHLYF